MKRTQKLLRIAVLILSPWPAIAAEWSTVAPAIEYREFTLDGPNRTFVARADRSKDNWIIEAAIAQGTLRRGLETVPDMAARYDESIHFDGTRYDVKVAINGDYFSPQTAQPPGGVISGGWFAKRYGFYTGGSGFVWTADRRCFLGGNLDSRPPLQTVTLADATELQITDINAPREDGELILYTPQYADNTGTTSDGVEVLVEVPRPVGVAQNGRPTEGTIRAVLPQSGSTPIPFDHVVLSAGGEPARTLRKSAQVGQRVAIRLSLKDYGVEDDLPAADWSNARAGLGGHFYCVIDGKVPVHRWEPKGKPGAVNRHPRTAVAMNDRYVYFIVVDGRSERSLGMTITELGRFCADHLRAEYAVAQDGGGSSTLWVDGNVMNDPSDGKLRPVANGYLIVLPGQAERSRRFHAGENVKTGRGAPIRLGPGKNYGVVGESPARRSGQVVEHRLNGVAAEDGNWWKCRFAGMEGWVAEKTLSTD